jgi:hypothetical protein
MGFLSPIVLFVYNRPGHTKLTIEALKKNRLAGDSKLFIYSDGPKDGRAVNKVKEVRDYLKQINGFKEIVIVERDKNWGLANSIIDGVTTLVNEYGSLIVLEDDLVTSPYFLNFMNDGLNIYRDDEIVASIHGYLYPIKHPVPDSFFIKGADCWGWATWDRAWKLFEKDGAKLLEKLINDDRQKEADFNNNYGYTRMLKKQINGEIDSWAIRWYMSSFLQNKLTLYPGVSHVANIGMDNSGVHNGTSSIFNVEVTNLNIKLVRIVIEENTFCRRKFETFYRSYKYNIIPRAMNRLKKVIFNKYFEKNFSSDL